METDKQTENGTEARTEGIGQTESNTGNKHMGLVADVRRSRHCKAVVQLALAATSVGARASAPAQLATEF